VSLIENWTTPHFAIFKGEFVIQRSVKEQELRVILVGSVISWSSPLISSICFMRRSIRNFNIPPPRAYPGHLTVHRARGGGNLNVVFEGWEFDPDLSLVLTYYAREFFSVFAGFDGFTRQTFAFFSE